MEQPLNILWQKSRPLKADLFIDIYAVPGHEIFPNGMDKLIDSLFQKEKLTPEIRRNNLLAERAREQGKKLFAEEKYVDAMTKFNCGLTLATKGSVEEALAFANRSACFFNLKMTEECLLDIEMAKNCNYPEQNMRKLEACSSKCTGLKNDEQFISSVFHTREPKLSFTEHTDFAGVADCLKIQENVELGRHIITTCDLKIGQTILVESPFSVIPKRFYVGGPDRCLNCFESGKNFMTCYDCVGGKFCDDDCKEKSFHKFECNMPGCLSRKETFELVLRMFFKIMEAFPSVDTLMNTVNLLLNGQNPQNFTDATQRAFCMVFKLPHNHDKQSHSHLKRLRSATNVAIATIMRFPDFNRKFTQKKQLRFLQHLILHLFHVAEHSINLVQFMPGDDEVMKSYSLEEFATGMYPFGCHFKHSCVPNVASFFVDSRLVCKVIRPVKKGEQLFRSYYPTEFALKARTELKDELENRYFFKCQCLVCTDENWSPMLKEVDLSEDPLYNAMQPLLTMRLPDIRKLPRTKIEEYEKNAIDFLTKYNRFHPVNDTICMQISLLMIWNIIATRF